MELLLWAERRKLRRSKILWIAGFATVMVALIVFAQGQFTFYESRYIDGAGWFMTAAQSLATFYVLPAVIALLGSYMICREEQEDTMKSLRLIPVDEVKLTLSKMAHDLGISQSSLSRVFSGTFHTNFNRYLNEARLDYACSLLLHSDHTILDICIRTGFDSQRTFNRVFQERYHMSPREYRKQPH